MNKLKAKLSAAVAMAVVIGSTLAPVAMADTDIIVKDNGGNSTNNVTVNNTDKTTVNQTNSTLIVNGVLVVSDTGDNTVNGNTGDGDVNIDTGKVVTKVKIDNTGSSNDATLPDCVCQDTNTTVKVKDNGTNSNNDVDVTNKNKLKVNQRNRSATINLVGAISKTGNNDASLNTGGGNTTVTTGKVKTRVKINNTGSSNTQN